MDAFYKMCVNYATKKKFINCHCLYYFIFKYDCEKNVCFFRVLQILDLNEFRSFSIFQYFFALFFSCSQMDHVMLHFCVRPDTRTTFIYATRRPSKFQCTTWQAFIVIINNMSHMMQRFVFSSFDKW